MGCCTSTARVNRPIRTLENILPPHQLPSIQDTNEEDEKIDEKQPVSSHYKTKSTVPDAPPGLVAVPNQSEDSKKIESAKKEESQRSVIISRKPSVFDLYRENILDLQDHQDLTSLEFRKSRLQTDESVFKLTIEQHEEILRFVDERIRYFNVGILRLYDNLCKNGESEHQDLLLFLEELRHNCKDIENCREDLLSYPFSNEREYMQGLQVKDRLMRRLISEYSNYQKNSDSYREFRNSMLKILLQYDSNLPDIKVSSLELAVIRIQKSLSRAREVENSLVFVPKEEMRWGREDKEKSELQHVDFNFELNIRENESKEDFGRQSAYNRHEILKSMQDLDRQELEEAIAKYYGLEEELEGLNEGYQSIQESWVVVREEIKKYKREVNAGDQENLEKIREMQDNLLNESEKLGRQYIDLQTEVKKLKVRLNENNGRQVQGIEFDSEEKINEMGYEIERKLKELVEITLVLPMMYKDIETQKREASEGLDPVNQAWEEEESKSPTKEQQRAKPAEKLPESPVRKGSDEGRVVEEGVVRDKEDSHVRGSLKLSKELKIAGPKTFVNESLRNLSSVLKGDVNEVSASDFEIKDMSIPYLQKRKLYGEYSHSYGLSHSTTVNSRENQNTLSQIDNTEFYLPQGHRMY